MAVPSLIVLLGWFLERLSNNLDSKRSARLSMAVVAAVALNVVILFLQQGPYW